MDPLSVAAGVIGVVTAAAQVSKILTTIVKNTKAAPKLCASTLTEVNDFKAILTHLQTFLLGTATAPKNRASLILVEQVIVTLTGCVTTFSELDEVLKGLVTEEAISSLDRVKWAMKELTIAAIVQRLQTHKASITLMLTILDCRSNDEAQQSMNRLCTLVEQVLQNNEDMSRRLRTLEAGPKSQGYTIRSATHDEDNNSDDASTLTPVPSNDKVTQVLPPNAFGFAFDEDLHNSKVYKRQLYSNSGESLVSSAARTTASSILSGLSLADVSIVSVFAIPVYAHEISNSQFYAFGDQPDRNEDTVREGGEIPSSSDDEPRSRLLGRWNPRDRLAKRAQGKVEQEEFNTNQSVEFNIQAPVPPKDNLSPSSTRLSAFTATFRRKSASRADLAARPTPIVFGASLTASIQYANVAIFVNYSGIQYVYGYVPIIVAKCGVFLKEKGTDVKDIFRKSGHPERMRLLQEAFDSKKANYGKDLDWTGYTVHDCANILIRYLSQLPDSVIPRAAYEEFREPLRTNAKSMAGTFHLDAGRDQATIKTYQTLVRDLPPLNRMLLLYIFDLLAVFASKSKINYMNSASLAVIFQAAILSPPLPSLLDNHAQDALIFLIENQDHFLIDTEGLVKTKGLQTADDFKASGPSKQRFQ